jgi:hypothetical protein
LCSDTGIVLRGSTLFQWLAVPLWVPTDKNSAPTDSGSFRSSASRTRGPPRARRSVG